MASFPRLFEPGRIGRLEVRNRIISAPMERNYCNRDGSVTQRYIDYLEARARGGVGCFFTEASYVDPRGKGRAFQLGVHDDAMIPGLTRLVQAVHRHGAKIGLDGGHPRGQATGRRRLSAGGPGERRRVRGRGDRAARYPRGGQGHGGRGRAPD